ncbi:MAG: hypothetical protein ACLP66_23030 [Polyangia bacterium]
MHWLASAAALLGLGCPTVARAQVQTMSDGIPIVVEAHLGWKDPLGTYGLALVYDRGGTFSGGLGVGLNSLKGDTLPPLGLFGRARLLRWGWGSLGVGAALSRDHYSSDQGDAGVWYWNPSYRATGTAAAELTNRRWSLRFEAGLGYLLNSYSECGAYYGSPSCDSSPGRLVPSLTATVGYRFGVSDAYVAAAAGEVTYKSPSTAFRLSALSTVVPVLVGATMLGFAHDDTAAVAGLVTLGLGLSLGPSIGYAYAGEQLRGWGLGLLRAAAIGVGSAAIIGAGISSSCDECTHSSSESEAEALGVVLITAALVSAVYDVATAPNAARRANTRHGLTNLSLAPMAIPGRTSTSPGLSLIGQF